MPVAETAVAVVDHSRTWSIVLTAVGSTLSVVFGLLILAVRGLSTRFDTINRQIASVKTELAGIVTAVCGNPKVEGDRGLAGKVNDHGADIATLKDRITDLERPRVRR